MAIFNSYVKLPEGTVDEKLLAAGMARPIFSIKYPQFGTIHGSGSATFEK